MTVFFLAFGLIMTGHAILTPMLMVILLITGDFLTMSLTTDTVQPSPLSNVWRIGNLTMASIVLSAGFLAFSATVMAIGRYGMGLDIGSLRTLASSRSYSAVRRRSMRYANASIYGMLIPDYG